MCLCPFARVRARVRVRACVRASVSACTGWCDSNGLQCRVCVRRGAVRALPSHGGGMRYLELGPCRALRPRAWLRFGSTGFKCRARSAAGVTWTCRTPSAPWAPRWFHTSVIDAAGAIYVIGGRGTYTYYKDVWASTDGGARPDLRRRIYGVMGGQGDSASGMLRGT